jgi:ankyrin repeat protein
MKKQFLNFLVIIIASAGCAWAADPVPEALQKGLLEEEVNQNLNAAIQLYQIVLKQFDDQRKVGATAAFRLGECYRKQGRTNEALAQFDRVVREFSDQNALVTLSQKYLADAGRTATASAAQTGTGGVAELSGDTPQAPWPLNQPPLTPEQAKLLQEEIDLVQVQIAETEKRVQAGNAPPTDLTAIRRQLIPLLRQLPQNASPAKQEDLIKQGIQYVQELLSLVQRQIDAGQAAVSDQIPLKRDLLSLQRELLAVQSAAQPSFQTRLNSVVRRAVSEEPSSFQRRLNRTARSAGEDAASDPEAQEIQRLTQMIKSSPDLINALNGGKTPLHDAVSKGQLTVVRFLLDNGAQVNARSKSPFPGWTALHFAATSGNKAMIELLVASGADVNAVSDQNGTALHIAARNGYQAVAQALLASGADVNAKDAAGATPLSAAVSGGHEGLIQLLLKNKADVNSQSSSGFTALMAAVYTKQPAFCELMLTNGADVNARTTDGQSALTIAVKNGALADLLLNHGADPNVETQFNPERTPGRFTPLQFAVQAGNKDLATSLLAHGARIDPKNNDGWTPLFDAISHQNLALVELLLSKNANPNSKDNSGETPLTLAVRLQGVGTSMQIVEQLLAHGADANVAPTSGGGSPLLVAVNSGNTNLIGALLAKGADVNLRSALGLTPLHVASARGYTHVMEVLLAKGADISPQDNDGNTPLHYAAYNGLKPAVEILLAHGAKVDVTNEDGLTPLTMINKSFASTGWGTPQRSGGMPGISRRTERQHSEIAQLLRQRTPVSGLDGPGRSEGSNH